MSAPDDAGPPEPALLTLAEAADLLWVTESAVIQMLSQHRLAGPEFEGRAPKGAGRVTRESAEALRRAREGAPRRGPSAVPPDPGPRGSGGVDLGDVGALQARVRELEGDLRRTRQSEKAARASLLAMKTTADQALDTARQERRLSRSLTAEVARLSALLDQANAQTERVDAAVQGYSETLTGLLVPPDVSQLDEP
jgi:hypothetical protein